MAYEVFTFTLTDAEVLEDDLAREGDLRTCPPGFAPDLPIEWHQLIHEKRQLWLQRLTPETICKRIEKACCHWEQHHLERLELMRCPHTSEPLYPDELVYLGVQLRFCLDCAMLIRGQWLEYEEMWITTLDEGGWTRRRKMQMAYSRWEETRQITWVHQGQPVALDQYKRQLGF